MTDYRANALLSRLVGCRLDAVNFVMDYVALCFDHADLPDTLRLTCDVVATVVRSERSYRHGDLGYADSFVAFVPEIVVNTVEATGIGLRIEFASGSLILHPSLDDMGGPEIAMLSGFKNGQWMVWRPGEGSFEDDLAWSQNN